MLITIAATIVVLGVLIFVHELGHFLTAKLVDIEVPRFSIGFGPRILGFRRGETEYVLSLLPLGGYVKMAGMEEMEVIEGKDEHRRVAGDLVDMGVLDAPSETRGPRDFESKSLGARALVISAGVIMNMIFAFLVFAGVALVWGVEPPGPARLAQPVQAELPAGAEALAGVRMGARVVAVGATRVEDWDQVVRAIATAPAGATVVRFADAPAVTITLPREEKERKALLRVLQYAQEPVVGAIMQGSAAADAGMRPGDRIVSVAGVGVA